MLRERGEGHEARVTNVELFFDLVFVFAVTQLSHTLIAHLDGGGVLRVSLLMLAVWWAWVYTAWVTNWLDPDHPAVRGMMFSLMGLGLVLSTSLPQAFDGRAVPFAFAYVGLQVGRSVFMTWAGRRDDVMRRNFVRISTWLLASGAIWLAGAFADARLRLPIWLLALAVEYAGPAFAFWVPRLGRTPTADWTVEGGHIAERCGLFIIICLGESVLMTGATFAETAWTAGAAAAFVACLAANVAMWWIYFNAHASAASRAIEHSDDPGRIARIAYTYAHIPLVAGIIVTAAGIEKVMEAPLGAADPWITGLVLGGPALFLAGSLWFKHSVFKVISPSRLAGLGLLAAAGAVAPWLSPLALATWATGALGVVAAWETLIQPRGAHTRDGAVSA